MKRLDCLLAILLLSGSAANAQSSPQAQRAMKTADAALDDAWDYVSTQMGYTWHTAANGMSVQFGVPETDDRAFRVDCENGKLLVIAPAKTNARQGTPTTATFQNGEKRPGSISYLGDGPNLVISLVPTDPVVGTLLTDGRIRIDTPVTVVSVAGAGGSALLHALVERCRAQKP